MKSYSEYKKSDSKLTNKIPKNWAEASLKRAVDGCVNGIWGNEPDGKNDIACIRVADFDRASNSISTEKLTFRSVSYSERANRLVKSGDLLIEKSGGGEKTLVGAVAIFQHDFDAVTSNFVAKMSPNRGYSPTFLNYCFSALYSSNINYCSIKQTTGIQNLDSEAYLQEKVGVPSYSEQQKIAQFLDYETAKIDALIDEQKRLIELLKEKRQAVISHAVTKGLNPDAPMKDSGVEWLGEVPAHWTVTPLKHILKSTKSACKTGPFGAHLKNSDMKGGPIKVVNQKNVISNDFNIGNTFISREKYEELKSFEISTGDVLITTRGTIGRSAIYNLSATAILHPCLIRLQVDDTKLMKEWLSAVISDSEYFLEQVLLNSNATTIEVIYSDTLINSTIAYPGQLEEQRQILDYLTMKTSKLEEQLQLAKTTNILLKERRSALISAAVTGKIDVRDWQPPAGSDTVDSNASVQTERHYG